MNRTVRFFRHEQVYHPMNLGEVATVLAGHTRPLIPGRIRAKTTPMRWLSPAVIVHLKSPRDLSKHGGKLTLRGFYDAEVDKHWFTRMGLVR